MTKGKSLHDRLARRLLSDVRVARGFCKLFFPKELLAEIDLSTLQPFKENFVRKNLRGHSLDLVYKINFSNSDEVMYLIIEHASTPHPSLPLRMRAYEQDVIECHIKESKNKEHPYVYSIILYSGEAPYAHPLNFFDRFPDHRQASVKQLALSDIPLVDIVRIPDDMWKKDIWFGLLGFTLKHVKRLVNAPVDDLWKMLEEVENLGEMEYTETIMNYIMRAGEASDYERLLQAMQKLDKEAAMTIAQYLEQRGIQKGREERSREIAKTMLENGVDIKIISKSTGQSLKDIKKLVS